MEQIRKPNQEQPDPFKRSENRHCLYIPKINVKYQYIHLKSQSTCIYKPLKLQTTNSQTKEHCHHQPLLRTLPKNVGQHRRTPKPPQKRPKQLPTRRHHHLLPLTHHPQPMPLTSITSNTHSRIPSKIEYQQLASHSEC